MQKSTKIGLRRVLLVCCILVIVCIGLFMYMLVYESREDVSNQKPYVSFLNKPHEIKRTSTIRWNKKNLRFSNYTLVINEDSHFDREDLKSVKQYQPGDNITFHAAKSYYSLHVDHTYYLIGRDTLDTGDVIEFEYYFSGGSPDNLFLNN